MFWGLHRSVWPAAPTSLFAAQLSPSLPPVYQLSAADARLSVFSIATSRGAAPTAGSSVSTWAKPRQKCIYYPDSRREASGQRFAAL